MVTIGKVTFWEHYAIDTMTHPKRDENQFLLPKNGIFFKCSLIVRPDIAWPEDQEMANYAKEKVSKLLKIGVLTKEAATALNPSMWDSEFVDCIIQFETLEEGRVAFEKAVRECVIDIYLYKDGELYQKYD